jgi:two-component system, cell cycle sensor histidine kinase and response regulator CckA
MSHTSTVLCSTTERPTSSMKQARNLLINLVQLITRNLTGRWQAEEALRESEQCFRELFEHSADAIAMITCDGIVRDVNRAACRLYDLRREDLLGQQAENLMAVGHWAAAAKRLDALVRGEIECIEVLIAIADDHTVPVEIRASEIYQHGTSALLLQMRNISERKQLEAQLLHALKMESVGRLACELVHDFNNLLTAINGYADLALDWLTPSDPLFSDLHEIQAITQRAGHLTHQLLAFARQQTIELRILDLNDFIRDLNKLLHHLIGEDIELITILAPDLVRIKANPGQIEQLLINLVINARDAMPKGGKLMIETRNIYIDDIPAQREGKAAINGFVRLSVTDTGIGMNETVKRRLFEPFYTTKAAGRGMGLGLAIIHRIIKQHGGYIEVDSEVGQGTTFTVYFPLC